MHRTQGVAKWVAFIDLDEFLLPVVVDNLATFLNDYEDYGGLCVNTVMFGTSNVEAIPENGLMIEYLSMAGDLDHKHNHHVKSIVRPDRTEKFGNPHFATYKKGFFQVNSDKLQFEGPLSPYTTQSKVRINHYYTRDINGYWKKSCRILFHFSRRFMNILSNLRAIE